MLKIEKGDINEVLQCIKKYPKYINMKNKSGNCALTTAIRLNDLEIIKLLLENKADINTQNKSNQTPIYISSFNNQQEVVELLLQYNANVKTPDQRGWSPLMIAANKGYVNIVKCLLNSQKCDIFWRNLRGETVFEIAKSKDVLNTIVNNCGYDINEIEFNLRNSIMCGVRTKLNSQNNSLYNSHFDAGSFYTKEVKRVQNNFKSICEKNHQQLNKLKSGLAHLQNDAIQKSTFQDNILSSDNKALLSENNLLLNQNKSSQRQTVQSTASLKVNDIIKNSPQISSFRLNEQNFQQFENNRAHTIETPVSEKGTLIKSSSYCQGNNITPSKQASHQTIHNRNMSTQSLLNKNNAIQTSAGQSTSIISAASQSKNNPSIISNKKINYNASDASNSNHNSSQKNSNKKVSSFIISDELARSSQYSSNQSNNLNQKEKSGELLSDLAQPYEENVIESARFKEIEEDFLTKSNSELILQYKTQLMNQIKALIPNINHPLYNQYEKSINYFIEQLICNMNLNNIQKILVLMQFQSQILIDLIQKQNSIQISQKQQIPATSSSFSQISNLPHGAYIDDQGKSFSYGEINQDEFQFQNHNSPNKTSQVESSPIPITSNLTQIQQYQLDIINQNNTRLNEQNTNQTQQKQQQGIKDKGHQLSKNKHFQMDGIIEQPTLEMIETPSQSQQQNKQKYFPAQSLENNQLILQNSQHYDQQPINSKKNTPEKNINDEYNSILTISSPKPLSEDYDLQSTINDPFKESYSNNQKIIHQGLQGKTNLQQNTLNIQNEYKQPPILKDTLNDQQFSSYKYFNDSTSSGKYGQINDQGYNYYDKLSLMNTQDLIQQGKYNTIESTQGVTNIYNTNKQNFPKTIEGDSNQKDFIIQYDSNSHQNFNYQNDGQFLNNAGQQELDDLKTSERDKNIFQKVHVFNGNKCQQIVMSSAQTSKAQSEIDYEISLSNSVIKSQMSQQQQNNNFQMSDQFQICQGDTQQLVFNQYDYITDSLNEIDLHFTAKQQFAPTTINTEINQEKQYLFKNKLNEGMNDVNNKNNFLFSQYKAEKPFANEIISPLSSQERTINKFESQQLNHELNTSPGISIATQYVINQPPSSHKITTQSPDYQVIQHNIISTSQQNKNDVHQSAIERLEKMQKTLSDKLIQIKENKTLSQQNILNNKI